MSSIKLSPNASGTGEFTIAAPNSNTNRTLTLPDQTGTVLTGSGPISVNASAPISAVTLDASGNLGVGTTSPAGKLHVVGNTYAEGSIYFNTSTGQISSGSGSWPLIFGINGTEKARIDSSGNLLVGTTADTSTNATGATFAAATNGRRILRLGATTTSSSNVAEFYNNNGNVGAIVISGTTTNFATSSDYRLKKDVQPMTGALARVAALKPCTYKWKADGSDGEGFIAHELAEVVPQCVTGEKDAVDEEGKPVYQGIDVSFLVGTLTAAMQEQQAIITALTARIEALEAK